MSEKPTGLRRYAEWLSRGKRTGRVAYVLDERKLPEPVSGGEWAVDPKFNAAQEILTDPSLKEVFKTAIRQGFAVVNLED